MATSHGSCTCREPDSRVGTRQTVSSEYEKLPYGNYGSQVAISKDEFHGSPPNSNIAKGTLDPDRSPRVLSSYPLKIP